MILSQLTEKWRKTYPTVQSWWCRLLSTIVFFTEHAIQWFSRFSSALPFTLHPLLFTSTLPCTFFVICLISKKQIPIYPCIKTCLCVESLISKWLPLQNYFHFHKINLSQVTWKSKAYLMKNILLHMYPNLTRQMYCMLSLCVSNISYFMQRINLTQVKY